MKAEKSLASRFPYLAAQWHPSLNESLTPNDVTGCSGKAVWWQCEKGHAWKARVYHRAYGCGCPVCFSERKTSFAEQSIYYYFQMVTRTQNRFTALGKEIDVYLPDLRIGIEHNGRYFHKDKAKKDTEKIRFFSSKGIRILTVQEGDADTTDADTVTYNHKKKASLDWAICTLFSIAALRAPAVDVTSDEQSIYARYACIEKERSLARMLPELAQQWHPSKNGTLTPDLVSFASAKRVWWLCEKGHEWRCAPASRQNHQGCPYCAGRKVLAGFNDLETTMPHLAVQWHPERNGSLTPQKISRGSDRLVWWICPSGHSWDASPAQRLRGEGCPYCAGKRVLAGYNDLSTHQPQLAKQWHPIKNGTLTPEMVTPHSDKQVWWQCETGHEWRSGIGDRSRGNGCPYCSGRTIIPGKNDLKPLDPELAAQWHPDKNGSLTPRDVAPISGKWVWWQCVHGHSWRAKISNRHWGSGCPVCANHIVCTGFNDLATTDPHLAAQWHPTKNADLKPEQVTRGMGKKIWWLCSQDHAWQACLYSRSQGSGCPVCYQQNRKRPST